MLFTHPACIGHDPGRHHPERPARLQAVLEALAAPDFDDLDRREARRATAIELERVHTAAYVRSILDRVPARGHVQLDPDTALSPGSGEAALRAAGAVCAAVDAVLSGDGDRAFAAVRPPGHHALPDQAMGFCLFNNVAVATRHGQAVHGLGRVAIVDFDVHHGNGTQDIFEQDGSVFYGSSHQSPCYPGTGWEGERGVGNVVNVGLAPGSGSIQFRRAYQTRILPALDAFAPELILISAGFDAHAWDPLASLTLTEDDFAWITVELVSLAKVHCGGRVVSSLEGGYDLEALAASVTGHVKALLSI